jgi:hypothetical protein
MTNVSLEKAEKINFLPVPSASYCEKYGNLIQSVTITVLDLFYLLGSAFSSIPKIVTDVAFNALNFSAFLSWSFYIDQTKKNVGDTFFSIKKSYLMTFVSSLKTIFIITSIALTLLNCCAATCRLVNCLAMTRMIYALISPFGIPCLVLSFLLDVLYFYIGKQVLNYKIKKEDIPLFFQSFSLTSSSNKFDSYASLIRGCIDKDTWKYFIHHLPSALLDKTKQEALYNKVLIPNIVTQQTVSISNVILKILGEMGMYISLVHPGTIIQASCWTFLSSLYSIQLLYQHYNQNKHRSLC